MSYAGKNYDRLLGMRGFSDQMLKAHFKLYEGYVEQINKMIDFLKTGDRAAREYGEIKSKFAWEFNGMRLHEAYFENMTKQSGKLDPKSDLAGRIAASFGSLEAWEEDFRNVSAKSGVGWAALAWDPERECLINIWTNGHDVGRLFYFVSLLVNDLFEHAYSLDYGADRKAYTDAFLKVVDWVEAQKRFVAIVHFSNAHAYSF